MEAGGSTAAALDILGIDELEWDAPAFVQVAEDEASEDESVEIDAAADATDASGLSPADLGVEARGGGSGLRPA